MGSISGQGIKIPYARELKPHMQQKKKKKDMISLWTFFWLVGGEELGIQLVWGRHACGSIQLTSPIWWGFSIYKTVPRYCFTYIYVPPLKGNQDLAPRLYYCFLTFPPFSLHPLPSLISNCFNLPIGIHRRAWRLNKAYFLLTRKQGTQKDLCTQDPPPPPRVLLGFTIRLSMTLEMCAVRIWVVMWSESHSVVSDSLWPHGLYSP